MSISQCRHEEDMCTNKYPKNDGCIFFGSRDIQQTSTLGLTRVPVLQTELELSRVNDIYHISIAHNNRKAMQTWKIYHYYFIFATEKTKTIKSKKN